jgi:chromosome segregation ATPase
MPKVALGKTLLDWESTLAGLAEDPALDQPNIRELSAQLTTLLAAVKELADEQNALEGRRRAITQQLRIVRRKGEDVAIKIRSAIRSVMGHRSAALSRFRIRPIRLHKRLTEEAGIAVYPRQDLLGPDGSQGRS